MDMHSEITNYCEQLVAEEYQRRAKAESLSDIDYFDVACIALNKLPPRYYRHSVDIIYFMSDLDAENLKHQVSEAVGSAISIIKNNIND